MRSIQPNKIALNVTGSQTALGRVSLQKYEVFVDASQGVPGKQRMQLQTDGFPDEVDVQLEPSSVFVYLDEKQRKEMPIQIEITGTPREGFVVGEPLVEPSRAIVTVTQTSVNDVVKVVGTIELDETVETVETSVPLVALDQQGKKVDVRITPAVVNVKVPVTSPFRTIPLRVNLQGNTPPGKAVVKVEQTPEQVTVYGKKEIVDEITYYEGPTVDLSALTQTETVQLPIPVVSTIARVRPEKVQLRVVLEEAETRKVSNVSVGMIGQSQEYVYNWQPNETGKRNLTVEIAKSRKNLFSIEGILASVDVTNLPPGTYSLPVDVQLPPFVELTRPEEVEYVKLRIVAKYTNE